jgi:DNA-binding transcriptional regulator YiaG
VRQATVSDWENANQKPSPMALRLLERTDVEPGER